MGRIIKILIDHADSVRRHEFIIGQYQDWNEVISDAFNIADGHDLIIHIPIEGIEDDYDYRVTVYDSYVE